MLISLAIPVYQNEGSLKPLHQRIVKAIKKVSESLEYEIIFTDDGSTDNSYQELLDIRAIDDNITVIKLSRNFGQHAAINAAFQHVKGDIVINMSADLQDPPEIIEDLINKIYEGNDVVLATRKTVSESFSKVMTSRIHYKLVRLSVPKYPDRGFDFWAVNKKAFTALMSFSDIIRRNQIDILSIGYKVATVEYDKQEREFGKSQYNFLKRLNISLSQILAVAFWPLRLASTFGFIFTILGFIYAIYLFVIYFIRDAPFNGWTPIMMLLLIIGGIIMLMLGIIGEYLWRIYFETKSRPLFFVDELIEKKQK